MERRNSPLPYNWIIGTRGSHRAFRLLSDSTLAVPQMRHNNANRSKGMTNHNSDQRSIPVDRSRSSTIMAGGTCTWDHVLQHKVMFASPRDAVVWLMERIDRGIPARLL